LVLKTVNSANILFLSPTPSYSHSVVYFPIIRELSLRGHKVESIMPDMINDPKLINLTEINIRDRSYQMIQSRLPVVVDQMMRNERAMGQIKWYNDYSYEAMDTFFQFPEVQNLIQHPENYHFDLVITEWITYQSVIAFADLFKCPLIGISSYTIYLHGHDAIGNPTHSTYLPNSWDLYVDPSSFWDRLKSAVYAVEYRLYYKYYVLPRQNSLVQKYFGNRVTRNIEEIEKDVSLVLTNTNPILHGAYPKVANLIEIGGLHDPPIKPLPKDLQSFLDSAKNGFIYFSLGSNIKSFLLGEKTINTILKVFKKLPYKVVWKYESTNLPGKPDNVYISQWLPQRAILEHPNIKLFMTQGGLQSTEEAIRGGRGVPFLIIPFFSDQSQNAGRFQQLGIGKRLLRSEITEENLEKSIYEVINNKRYKNAVIEISKTLWDQPTNPLDRAIWWIEYVIRHKGAKYLRNPELDAPWYQVQLLDVYLFIFSLLVLIIVLVSVICKKLYLFIKLKTCKKSKKIKKQ
ncbi:UDP-glycosyltransferase UGT4-like, partial [Chrysoperla carnea]|uniref:UDP-glycosyltransferase UGT4-like n=1 Tax=Chrysoperla carnea TaxID=189513 RepID=UPI001D06B676